ncbi:GIY-YIG nuclease family protein [Marinimicrobium alkaliphilum]|uniref:GIY-YIG nuclease family protein n=1 Tax=Marinimicrobium alkaliphilum TaxID=2202654 RepID=UPI000DBA0C1F|nr:GIY-YIG nuclease family protein [Marinimicrobium alkaliphilum]
MSHEWQVYIILSSDNQLYTGITTDIERRWREHTRGKAGARYFRGRTPAQLCYLETGHDRSSASQREAAIKKLSRAQKNTLIASRPRPTQPGTADMPTAEAVAG